MNLTKDTYEYLLNFAEDRDVINMLSVNRKFNDEKLFEKIMRKKYPELIREKKKGESWKSLFVRIVYYMSLLQEKYGIPYFPGLDIVFLFTSAPPYQIRYQIGMAAAREGHVEILKLMNFDSQTLIFQQVLEEAVRNGRLNIVEFLLPEKLKTAESLGMYAAVKGKLDIVKYIINNKFVNNQQINRIFEFAQDNDKHEIANWINNHLKETLHP